MDLSTIAPVASPPELSRAAPVAEPAPLNLAAESQGGGAPLLNDLLAAARTPGPPHYVQKAVNDVLALRIALNTAPSPADVRAALQRSGLYVPPPPVTGGGDDMKTAMHDLQSAVKGWLSGLALRAPVPPPVAPAGSLIDHKS